MVIGHRTRSRICNLHCDCDIKECLRSLSVSAVKFIILNNKIIISFSLLQLYLSREIMPTSNSNTLSQKYPPSLVELELVIQKALNEVSFDSDFEDDVSALDCFDQEESARCHCRSPVDIDFRLASRRRRSSSMCSRWESGSSMDECTADLKLPRRQATNEAYYSKRLEEPATDQQINPKAQGMRYPHRRSSNDSDNCTQTAHPRERISRAQRCSMSSSNVGNTSTTCGSPSTCRRGSFTLSNGKEDGYVTTRRGSFTMTITDQNEYSEDVGLEYSSKMGLHESSNSALGPRRPNRRSSVVLALTEDSETSPPAPTYAAVAHWQENEQSTNSSSQSPRRPCRRSSLIMSFDPEEEEGADQSSSVSPNVDIFKQGTVGNISNNRPPKPPRRHSSDEFNYNLAGSYVRGNGSSVYLHQNGNVMLTFANSSTKHDAMSSSKRTFVSGLSQAY